VAVDLDPEVGHLAEVDRTQRGDIGDGEPRPGEVGPLRQLGLEPVEPARYLLAHDLAELGGLPDPAVPERVGVAEHLRDRDQQLELGVAVPLLDLRALQRSMPNRLGSG